MADKNESRRATPEEVERLKDLVRRANSKDLDALDELKTFLDDNPPLWQQLGDVARLAEEAWIRLISKGDSLLAESLRRQFTRLKGELIGENPSAIEKMLGDQVMVSWLELKQMEMVSADAKPGTIGQEALMLKRLESAQRRYLAAIKSLTQMRKLLPQGEAVPGLKIYAAEQRATG